MQFGSVAATTQLRNRGAVATGSSAKSRNRGGIADFRFLTVPGLDPVATTTPAGLPGWGPRSAPQFCRWVLQLFLTNLHHYLTAEDVALRRVFW